LVMRMISKNSNKISTFMCGLGAACLIVMVCGQTYEVVLRYVFSKSTGVMDEIVSLGLVGIMVTGIGYTLRKDGHVRITMLTERLSPKTQHWLALVMSVVSLVGCILAAYYLFGEAADSFRNKVRSLSPLSTQLYMPQTALGVGFAWLAWELVMELYATLGSMRKQH